MRINQILAEGQSTGIQAFHGTGHDFDRFLMKAVGTGEGAQVFGYGLYFAENYEVARFYADKLGQPKAPTDQHAGIVYEVRISIDPAELVDWDRKLDDQSEYVQKVFGASLYRDEPLLNGKRFYDALPSTLKPMWKIITLNLYLKSSGDLDALERGLNARVLNPTADTQAAIETIMGCLRQGNITSGSVLKPGNGGHLLNELQQMHKTPKAATQALRAIGVKGIRYLDEGSREVVGKPTSNFVIFNARHVRIVGKTNL